MMVQFDVKRVQKGAESFMVSFDFTKTPITQIADFIIIAASKHNSSDIHFDPREEGMMVRFRIDGDCQDYTFVPKAYEKNLVTRLKLLANMNITESRLPQDGAIKGNFGDQYLDMRVSALPLNEGEKIVIRILDYTRSLQGIDTLGFHPKNLEKVKRMMGIPNGIILTTGATGSGKSTTTYSILQGLNKPETNIITVEDPIEMNIEGINQVQVNADIGMTFAAALRSILRQDPNIILIGEIRDSETAQIAVRASITGHLVLSTIHTNNALATVERLLDMDVERYLLSTALSGIISQRLAKMLCTECRYQRETTKYEKKVFKKYMNMDITHVWDANPKGCEHCRRGYHGRIAIHEVLEIDDDIRAALSNDKLDKKDLAKMVYSGSTITMLQDALIKCLEGKTSFEEVYRTIEIENEDDDNYENEIATEIMETIPTEEDTQVDERDDLLDTPVNSNNENNVVAAPLLFTPADFHDNNVVVQNTPNNTVATNNQVINTPPANNGLVNNHQVLVNNQIPNTNVTPTTSQFTNTVQNPAYVNNTQPTLNMQQNNTLEQNNQSTAISDDTLTNQNEVTSNSENNTVTTNIAVPSFTESEETNESNSTNILDNSETESNLEIPSFTESEETNESDKTNILDSETESNLEIPSFTEPNEVSESENTDNLDNNENSNIIQNEEETKNYLNETLEATNLDEDNEIQELGQDTFDSNQEITELSLESNNDNIEELGQDIEITNLEENNNTDNNEFKQYEEIKTNDNLQTEELNNDTNDIENNEIKEYEEIKELDEDTDNNNQDAILEQIEDNIQDANNNTLNNEIKEEDNTQDIESNDSNSVFVSNNNLTTSIESIINGEASPLKDSLEMPEGSIGGEHRVEVTPAKVVKSSKDLNNTPFSIPLGIGISPNTTTNTTN